MGLHAVFLIFAFVAPAIGWLLGSGASTARHTDLYIVYTPDTRASAEALAKYLERFNLTVELRPASDFRVQFRAYPAVLIAPTADPKRLASLGLASMVVRGPEGAPLLAYDIVLQLVRQLEATGAINGTSIHFNANMTLYIIEGVSPAARVKSGAEAAKTLVGLIPFFEAVFAAKSPVAFSVINVTQAREKGIPVDQLKVLPAVVAESEANLTSGTLLVERLAGNYYTLVPDAMVQVDQLLSRVSVVDGYEVMEQPPNTTGLILVGNPDAPAKMVVYWDFMCPFSARFNAEVVPLLARLAERGTISLYFADLLVHPQAFKLHQLGHCVYQEYGAEKFLEYASKAFRAASIGGNATQLNKLVEELEAEYNVTGCNAQLADGDAARLGVTGTPTVVAWSDKYPRLVFIIGVRDAKLYKELAEWLATR